MEQQTVDDVEARSQADYLGCERITVKLNTYLRRLLRTQAASSNASAFELDWPAGIGFDG